MFVPRWSAKLEYFYVDTDSVSVNLFGVPFSGRARDHIVRAGGQLSLLTSAEPGRDWLAAFGTAGFL
jgi:hypothetical protein